MRARSRSLFAILTAAPLACAPLIGADFDDAVLRETEDSGPPILAPDEAGTTARDAASARAPDALASLTLWLRADDGVDTSAAGSAEPRVVRWRDRSRKANDARQPEALFGPRLMARARGALPAIELDGVSRFLEIAWPQTLGGEATVLVALRGSAAAVLAFRDGEGSQGMGFGRTGDDEAPALVAYDGERTAVARTGAPTDRWTVVAVRARAKATGGLQLWHDGVASEATTWSGPDLPRVDTLAVGRLRGRGDGPDLFATALVGEIVIFSRALPDDELDEMQRYLAGRWATPAPE